MTPVATSRTLLQVDGFIEALFVQPNGRLLVIYRQGQNYRLVRAGIGGPLSDQVLFTGSAGYRFGSFTRPDGHDYLVINPPERPQLLLLDIHSGQPDQITIVETAVFRDRAVFATTPNFLYRISGGWIMRGSVQAYGYAEDAIATAHRSQTWLTGSRTQNQIAGLHRIFAAHHFFTISPNGQERPLTPPPAPSGSHLRQAALTFTPTQIGLVQWLARDGQGQTVLHSFNLQGIWQQSWDLGDDTWETAVEQYPFISANEHQPAPLLTDGDRLHHHPAGWIIQQAAAVKFWPTQTKF